MKSLSKLGKTIMKVRTMNLYSKKSKNNDKKVSNTVPQQTSTLKAVPLAVLMALNTGTLATDATCRASENDAKIETTALVSANAGVSQNQETISQADKKNYDFLFEMMFGVAKGEKINLKKTDKILICYLKDIRDYNTDKPLGDAILIQYKHPENKDEYNRLKNAGQNPESINFPVEEMYLIPITNEGVRVDARKNLILESIEEERCAQLKVSKNCFKLEKYPDIVCEMNSMGYVSTKDGLKYFNYNKDGWHGSNTGMDRCGMTKEFYVSVDEVKLIMDCMANNY